MFGCYRKGDANDPDTYTAAITAILAEYPEPVVLAVTDPRTGIPRKLKWLPAVAEVAEACDAEVERIRVHAHVARIKPKPAPPPPVDRTPELDAKMRKHFESLLNSLRSGELKGRLGKTGSPQSTEAAA